MNLVWTDTAITHLEAAWDYVKAASPAHAGAQLDRILDAAYNLVRFPDLGRRGRIPGTRELIIPDTPFLLAYRVRRSQIEILAVLHGARRWPEKF